MDEILRGVESQKMADALTPGHAFSEHKECISASGSGGGQSVEEGGSVFASAGRPFFAVPAHIAS